MSPDKIKIYKMKNINNNKKRRAYEQPLIMSIHLDNEISLWLASDPPIGPGETKVISPEFANSDPFKLT